MKKHIALGLALAAACTSSFANWAPVWLSGAYSATMTYGVPGGPSRTLTQTEAMGYWGAVQGPIGAFASVATSVQPKLQAAINTWAAGAAAAGGTRMSGGVLTGQIHATISGEPGTSLNKIVFSVPQYTVSFSASGSKLGISYTCTSNVTLSNLVVSTAYDPTTSAIDSTQSSVNFTSSTSSSCSSALDWLPIIGSAVDRFVAGKVTTATLSQLNSFSGTAIQNVLPTAPQYLGVNSSIASGVYVFDGVDWGAFIKNNFASLFIGKTLNLTFGVTQPEGVTGNGLYLPPSSYSDAEFVIDFSDPTRTLSFAVTSHTNWDYKWYCVKSGVCMEP